MSYEVSPYTILFVEDEEAIRSNYVQFLKRYYREVYEAADGEIALEMYKNKKPDILIVDINIPKINGLELLKIIREHDHTTKAIVLTAHADISLLMKATELKLSKYLVKPVTRGKLKEALLVAQTELKEFTTISNSFVQLSANFSYNLEKEELLHDNLPVYLTKSEIKLISLMLKSKDKIFGYDDIIYELWDEYDTSKLNSLKTLIKNLRKKLPKDTVKNVFGMGYKM